MKHEVSPVSLMGLEEFAGKRNEASKAHIDTVSDISIELGVNLGHKVDVYLSNMKVGIGEAIVMDEKFGIIISEIEADKKQAALMKAQSQMQDKE